MQAIDGYARYAVYWAPPAGSGLATAGARWLGWDPERRQAMTAEGGSLAKAPARYGLHATLKPPFRLAGGRSAAELDAALGELAAQLGPATAPGLAVDAGLGFLALRPAGPCPEVDALAAACVEHLDAFRAAPDRAETARRRALGLDATGEALLARWGYPYVMERFRFHVTLTGPVTPAEAETLRPSLATRFEPHCPESFRLAELCLFGDPGGGEHFHLLRRHRLAPGQR